MIINHNISALNAHRQLGANQGAVQNSLEKLSSGLGINKAGDDAAGLAISEKMRAQISGLEMAGKNAQDGISLIQTAEGAMNESHAILQRMRELAVQSANDTNTDSDRAELQKEVDQLAEALTDISKNTQFNEKDLLTGAFAEEGLTFHVGANQGQALSVKISDMSADALNVTEDYTVVANKAAATEAGQIYYQEAQEPVEAQTIEVTGNTFTYTDASGAEATATWADADSDPAGDGSLPATEAGYFSEDGELLLQADAPFDGDEAGTGTGTAEIAATKGTEAGYYNSDSELVIVTNDEIHAVDAEVKTGINISSQTSADAAITTIQSAIDNVSAERSKLGAVQNRLDHTINNLGTSQENLTAAESRIRDVDMAKEMMEFTKNNILSQAAQSMLAQSQQIPNGVLQLLQ
ncbi:flagellin N-terminal helical domain-containing protein [Oceanobacillus alkalisoli]|uniref:flagellin N-terminal helical domain-containing protein n=1 Tax=Oceanobacillus alkalisoli TaxID=2925113 RepID=UPI001EE44D9F|nr:flagellin [Oceanobacillus alkalisoli]MCG5102264.1 flagellin [Oceanobacillus alkalisoli]